MSDLAIGTGGGGHALQRLDLATETWSEPQRVRSDGLFSDSGCMRAAGVVVLAGSTPWVITAHGAYEIDPADGRVDRLGGLDDRCSSRSAPPRASQR